MTNKYIEITFSNGKTYHIPAYVIAHSRATHYANVDEGEQTKDPYPPAWTKVYNEERTITLQDDGELMDWASNSMDWEDVEKEAILESTNVKEVNLHKEWIHRDKSVIKK